LFFVSLDYSAAAQSPHNRNIRGGMHRDAAPRQRGEETLMSDEHLLSRREFTLEWALAILAGATITITGCGGDDDPGTGPSGQGDEVGTISANHGHSVTILAAQITSGGALTATLSPGNGHTHTIDLTAAQVVAIGQNQQVSVVSTTNEAHNHTVTFN
jgi:hypothetical protein